jgi:ABC-2 type transport system ATP-binding protein
VGGPPASGRALRAACGLLTETPGFYDRMTARENLRFFGRLYGMTDATVRERSERYLRLMDLWERRDSVVGTFSKGMKQRLAIIRALFHDPRVVFLDEPTAGLDPEAARDVRELIRGLKAEGRTLLVCTHNLDEAERLADIVGILRRRLVACDTLERLRAGGDGGAVRITLAAPVERFVSAVRALPVVRDVRADGTGLIVRVTERQTGVPAVVSALAAAGAPVLEVRPDVDDLEAVYLRAVRDEP